MESNKKKRKANAFTGWLDHDDEDKVIQVELCDGKAFVHRNFLIHQCRQVELSFQNCPEQTEPFLIHNFSRKTFITFRALLYTNRILPLTHLPTDKEEFVKWCEVYALCDFLEFELEKNLLLIKPRNASIGYMFPLCLLPSLLIIRNILTSGSY